MIDKAKYILIGGDYDGEFMDSYHYKPSRDYKGNCQPNNPFARVPPNLKGAIFDENVYPKIESRQKQEPKVYFKHCLTKGDFRYWFYYVNEHINPDELDIEQTYLRLSRVYAKSI